VKQDEIESKELEALYKEKCDKLNSRLSVWSVLITIFGAFSYAGTQTGIAGYLIIFYPLLAGCVARFAGSSERVLDRVKRRIYQIEETSGYEGYEHNNATTSQNGSGAHIKALRDFVLLTDGIAIIALSVRLVIDHMALLAIPAIVLEATAIVATCIWMHDKPAHQPEHTIKQNGLNPDSASDSHALEVVQ
jgi:hypothetical protein